jgi:autotransporter adhesin
MGEQLSRREVIVRGAGAAVAVALGSAALAGGAGALGRGSGDKVGGGGTVVVVPEYPFFAGSTMQEDPKFLNALARKYVAKQGDREAVMTRFLFSSVPVTLFDRIYATKDPANTLPMGAYLWLFHLSGYFGGVWLRGELVRTGKNAGLSSYSKPQDKAAFTAEVAKADEALDAASGPAPALLEYEEASLYDTPPVPPATMPTRGLVDTFGYNEGYLLQIAEKPPVGLSTPTGLVDCPVATERPLYCSYGTSRLQALRRFDPISQKLASGKGAYADLAKKIPPLQEAAITRGRGVWDGALNVQGFSQEAYEQLLDISSAFLETVQATVLATVKSTAQGSVPVGRQAATANACMGIWLSSYLVGITDGRPDRKLPEFEAL